MWMNHGFWYDRKLCEKRQIVDVSFVGALGPPGGGRQIVTNRFLRYFNFVSFPELVRARVRVRVRARVRVRDRVRVRLGLPAALAALARAGVLLLVVVLEVVGDVAPLLGRTLGEHLVGALLLVGVRARVSGGGGGGGGARLGVRVGERLG